MTGPEHYTAAEEFIETAKTSDIGTDSQRLTLMAAQVHATLALAAATAMAAVPVDHGTAGGMDQRDFDAWDAVAGVQE